MLSSRRILVPGAHQDEMIEHIFANPRCGLFAPMGSGKTSGVLLALSALEMVEPGRTMVLAPRRVARNTWPEESVKWEQLRHLSVVPITGTPAERIKLLQRDASVHTINYDVLPWLIEYLKESKRKWRWSRVIADESTRLKNFRLKGGGGARARAIGSIAHTHVRRWINLTGTPSPNGLINLWGQTWFLDEGARLGRTLRAFEDRWFNWERRPNPVGSNHEIKQTPKEYAQQQINAAIGDICLTPTLPFAVDKPVFEKIYVDLPPKARKLYDEMEKRMFVEIDGHPIEALTAASKSIKTLQLAGGAAYLERDETKPHEKRKWVEIHDVKLQALESIVSEADGMPLLVAYQFQSERDRILKAFPGAVDISTDEGMRVFKTGRAVIGLAHPKSMGHGIDGLQDVTNLIAFFGHWWDLEQYQQIIDRIGPVRQHQSGHKRPVFVYLILARDTVDDDVMLRRITKAEVQDLVTEGLKRRQGG